MGFNLTTDDGWDERESMGLNRPSKPNNRLKIRKILNDKEEVIFEGNWAERMKFLRNHFGWTGRMTKRGRWQEPFKLAGYKTI